MDRKKLLYVQIISFLISSVSLSLTSFVSYEDGVVKKVFSIIVGLLFWIGLAVGIAFIFVLKSKTENCFENEKGVGLVRFFKNKFAICFDVAMIVWLIASIVVIAIQTESFIGSVVVALFVFSFEMHCVLNGKIYKCLMKTGDKKHE